MQDKTATKNVANVALKKEEEQEKDCNVRNYNSAYHLQVCGT